MNKRHACLLGPSWNPPPRVSSRSRCRPEAAETGRGKNEGSRYGVFVERGKPRAHHRNEHAAASRAAGNVRSGRFSFFPPLVECCLIKDQVGQVKAGGGCVGFFGPFMQAPLALSPSEKGNLERQEVHTKLLNPRFFFHSRSM